jgi:hypothetical protein
VADFRELFLIRKSRFSGQGKSRLLASPTRWGSLFQEITGGGAETFKLGMFLQNRGKRLDLRLEKRGHHPATAAGPTWFVLPFFVLTDRRLVHSTSLLIKHNVFDAVLSTLCCRCCDGQPKYQLPLNKSRIEFCCKEEI